ncbi:MAG: two-component sensor histidine kinase, partial [Alphaproteobacteria bacterium]|nr:two-component sensor histidine kinase [Alphaproteobacteria bacterium]
IPEGERDVVFQRFYRSERSRNLPGHGLGLSFVQAAVELHNGTITLSDNQPGLKITISV